MAAPVAGIAIRYLVQRVGGFALKTVAKQYGKRTSRQRMVEVGRKVGGKPLAPALQGPYSMAPEATQSTRGEHSGLAGHLETRKSMRDGSAQKRSRRPPKASPSRKRKKSYFGWRDEEQYEEAMRHLRTY